MIAPPDEVIQLPNLSAQDRHSSYELNPEDLREAISRFGSRLSDEDLTRIVRESFIIWHTHPSGFIGPSDGDLKYKIEGFRYLVVSLPGGEASSF